MAGSQGCHDDVAATIIFIFNSVALLLSLGALSGISYIWYTQATPQSGNTVTLSVFIPEAMLGLGIFVSLFVLTIALLGIITTCLEMRANKIAQKKREANGQKQEVKKDKNGKPVKEKKPKRCCHNAGLLVYIGMSLFAFFFLMAAAVVCGIYSGKLDHVNYVSQAKSTGDPWVNVLDTQVSNAVVGLATKYSTTWNDTQAALGCCGWNTTDAATTNAATTAAAGVTTAAAVTTGTAATTTTRAFNHDVLHVAYTQNSKCCIGNNVVTEYTAKTGIKLDKRNCWMTDDADSPRVYTCQGMVARHIQGNMVKLCVCAVAFALVQLALAIAGCVVRFPRMFPRLFNSVLPRLFPRLIPRLYSCLSRLYNWLFTRPYNYFSLLFGSVLPRRFPRLCGFFSRLGTYFSLRNTCCACCRCREKYTSKVSSASGTFTPNRTRRRRRVTIAMDVPSR